MQTYLVTGASGYIASWIVKFLLEQGEKVHGTIRSLKNKEKIIHLIELQQKYPGQLSLFEADLLNMGSFREAMKGCNIILHTASPFVIAKIKDAQRELIQPALEGTRNVLTLANEFPEVRRIVVTSSVAAIYSDAADINKTKNNMFTEEHWNTKSNAKHNPYQYSKTIAEREAWKIAGEQQQWKLTTINPGFVMGPSLSQRVDSTSVDMMRSIINGKYKSGVPDLYFGVVDVRDVAKAHILAATNANATGRHICVSTTLSLLEMAKILREKYPNLPIPKSAAPKILLYIAGPLMGFSWKFINLNVGIKYSFDNSKSIGLGVKYTPIQKTLTDHAMQLVEDGLV
ncbi:MAG: aldehyde reductase [Bacteroidales bacterium]|nr:aldehyde reductase [Bacteroidales bacterium]